MRSVLVAALALFAFAGELADPVAQAQERAIGTPVSDSAFVTVRLDSGESFLESFDYPSRAYERATEIARQGYYDRRFSPHVIRFYPADRIAYVELNTGNNEIVIPEGGR